MMDGEVVIKLRKTINHSYFTLAFEHYFDPDGGQDYITNVLPGFFMSVYGCGLGAVPPGEDEHASGTGLYNSFFSSSANIQIGEALVIQGRLPAIPATFAGP